MRICRLIAPEWAMKQNSKLRRVLEGIFTDDQLAEYNADGYNIYYLPNHPGNYNPGAPVDGSLVDVFNYVFVDCDLKDGIYATKDDFLAALADMPLPSLVNDSGNGVHAYWKISDLDAINYLRFQRRLLRRLNTDEAVGQLFQLMRLPGYINTKNPDNLVPCETLFESDTIYTSEEMNNALPPITREDEQYCQQHYDKTYNLNQSQAAISDEVPPKFGQLLLTNAEAKALWTEPDDRSKADYRLGHLMFANGFTRQEALDVLGNSAKALARAPIHRKAYAENIIDKIWTFELGAPEEKAELSMSVKELLQRGGSTLKGTPFRCHPMVDNTDHGFRLGQVIGFVAGSGVGKTAVCLNMFRWFVERNPDYDHFIAPLEQPANEIADRWATLCGEDTALHDKVHVISNYGPDGEFRHLSLEEIKEYILKFQKQTGRKAGCVVIDHIGALKKAGKEGENQSLMDICHQMKAFAVQTNTMLIMQSQASREKAGIGDLELNKDAAYGTVYFESYCDYLMTMWQPLKRLHKDPACPTVTAFKFCKIRHKKARKDVIQEDVCYQAYFDPDTERLRPMTQSEIVSFNYFLPMATNKRKADRKTDLVEYTSIPVKVEADETKRH